MFGQDIPSRHGLRAGLLLAVLLAGASTAEAAKNIILMVSDGAGFNTWIATSMYQGKLGQQPYDAPQWTRLACCTYPWNRSTQPTGSDQQDSSLIYSPAKAWEKSLRVPEGQKPLGFAGYGYLTSTCTDSAAAATAMATGVKTYDNAINWTNQREPLRARTIAEIAHAAGKSVGVITTVPWSHATPAGLGGAHNRTRNDYNGIANEMLDAPYLDVIMGAGHPDFTDDGTPRPSKGNYQYVGGATTWKRLAAGTHPGGWKLFESQADFEALAKAAAPPAKVLGTAQVASTLQEQRFRKAVSPVGSRPEPFSQPLNRHVPDLETMTRGALNCLGRNPNGFYLMIEGGAVDWANHANQPERMIEEQVDFLKSLQRVVAWVEAHGGWQETLLIVTADHECGLLWGPKSDTAAFDPLHDCGAGKIPEMRYNSHGHSNSLVPLYARGSGSEDFAHRIVDTDAIAAAVWGFSGQYVDNTAIFQVMQRAIGDPRVSDKPVQQPAARAAGQKLNTTKDSGPLLPSHL